MEGLLLVSTHVSAPWSVLAGLGHLVRFVALGQSGPPQAAAITHATAEATATATRAIAARTRRDYSTEGARSPRRVGAIEMRSG